MQGLRADTGLTRTCRIPCPHLGHPCLQKHRAWTPRRSRKLYSLKTTENGDAGPLDAILVLGGGLHADGRVPTWATRRLQLAADMWKAQRMHVPGRCPPVLLLGAGTPHKPAVVTAKGAVVTEASAYADEMLTLGLPASSLLKECSVSVLCTCGTCVSAERCMTVYRVLRGRGYSVDMCPLQHWAQALHQ